MKEAMFGIGYGIVGTLLTLAGIMIILQIRAFITMTHFCPQCGHTKYGDALMGTSVDWGAECLQCHNRFWLSSDDYRRSYPRVKGDKGISMKLSADWKECFAVILHWKVKKLKDGFSRTISVKASENKS